MARPRRSIGKKLTDVLLETFWRSGGKYPPWGTSPEWDEVLLDKQTMADCARYHCLPSQLDEEDYHVLQRHRAIEAAERAYLDADRKARASRGKGRRR